MLHQIWLSEDIPDTTLAWIKTFVDYPGYKLWRSEDIKPYLQCLQSADLLGYHPSIQADLLRLLILRDFGGWYVDCDATLNKWPTAPHGTAVGMLNGKPDPYVMYGLKNDPILVNMIRMCERNGENPLDVWGYRAYTSRWEGNVLWDTSFITHYQVSAWKKEEAAYTAVRERLSSPQRVTVRSPFSKGIETTASISIPRPAGCPGCGGRPLR